MPEETPSPDQNRPAAHRKAHRTRLGRPRRYGFLFGWITLTSGTIVVSSLALQAAFREDRDDRPVQAPHQALNLSQYAASPSSTPPAHSPSPRAFDSPSEGGRYTGSPRVRPQREDPPPAERRTPPPRPKVTITSPREQARVPGDQGVLLKGTATGLGDLTLHIFDLADNGSYYPGSLAPVSVRKGRWSFHKRPIGRGSADVGHTFVLIAVLGDDACRAALRTPPVNPEGDYAFAALPEGCREMDSVQVIKAAP